MAACTPTPTATEFATITSTELITTFTRSRSTLPAITSVSTFTTCLLVDPLSSSCISSTTDFTTTTIPGAVTVTQFPVTLSSFTTFTSPTTTLFATCPDTTKPPVTNDPGPTTGPTAGPSDGGGSSAPPPGSSGSSGLPPPASNSTLPGGVGTTTVYGPNGTTTAGGVTQTDQGGSHGSNASTGAIVGGVVGGFVGLIAIVTIAWFFFKRRKQDDPFAGKYTDDDMWAPQPIRRRSGSMDMAEVAPRPYVYGSVGSHGGAISPDPTPAPGPSPPGSPTPGHTRHPSLQPLVVRTPGSASSANNSFANPQPTPPPTSDRRMSVPASDMQRPTSLTSDYGSRAALVAVNADPDIPSMPQTGASASALISEKRRIPRRESDVLVHRDGGAIPGPSEAAPPPAYSPH